MLSEADIARLAWLNLPGVGPKTVRHAFADIWNPSFDADSVLTEYASQHGNLERLRALDEARRMIVASQAAGVRIVPVSHPAYPEPFRRLADPPPFAFVLGTLPEDWENAVAVIGTREPSAEAIEATRSVVDALASEKKTIVVSGLAKGTDTVAHERALGSGIRTVAVLANGLDTVYPKGNAELARRIVAEGGCLISETPTGRAVSRFNLVARDRLQSGLSQGTFLMQSGIDGGSMHTALFTLQQRRTLIVYRPTDVSREWAGNWFLLDERYVAESEKGTPGRFARLRRPFAFGMSRAILRDLIAAGLRTRFTPKQSEPEPQEVPLLDVGQARGSSRARLA